MEDDRDADPPPAVERPPAVREAGGDQLDILLDLRSIIGTDTTIPVMLGIVVLRGADPSL
ncbi:hypothetical protein ACWEV3_31730 [Saccharopolyspora sp. NPDC003752]